MVGEEPLWFTRSPTEKSSSISTDPIKPVAILFNSYKSNAFAIDAVCEGTTVLSVDGETTVVVLFPSDTSCAVAKSTPRETFDERLPPPVRPEPAEIEVDSDAGVYPLN
jgi:hypothetical protein